MLDAVTERTDTPLFASGFLAPEWRNFHAAG
jgi:hypothetical protein